MRSKLFKCLAVAVAGLALNAQAIPITGGISLAGSYRVVGGDLNSANAFEAFPVTYVVDVSGAFQAAGVAGLVNMNAFSFDPFPVGGVLPLWRTVSIVNNDPNAPTASFDLTSLFIETQGGNTLTLKGMGTLYLAGYEATPGDWTWTANQGGATFSWSSSNGAVPDGGTTALLLGAALSGLALIRRRLA